MIHKNEPLTEEEISTLSEEQILERIDHINIRLGVEFNTEQSLKLWMNSSYGTFGSPFFILSNPRVAEAITSTGKSIILHTEKITNDYFMNDWHKDTELHKNLGITQKVKPLENPVIVYAHTDSNYFSFDELLTSCGMDKMPEKETRDFLIKLDSTFLSPFYDKSFDEFTSKRNLKNDLVFETESIARKMVILAVNINFQNISMYDGQFSDSDKVVLKYTGGKIKSSTTPKFARNILKSLFEMISDHRHDITIPMLTKKLKEIKKEIMVVSIDEIAETGKMTNYEQYVIEDKDNLITKKGTPFRVSAAAKYNHALYKQKDSVRNRYKPIIDSKIKVYSTTKGEYFAYNLGEYPLEFAPPPDREGLFDKFILKTVNDILERSMKVSPLSRSLVYAKPLFG